MSDKISPAPTKYWDVNVKVELAPGATARRAEICAADLRVHHFPRVMADCEAQANARALDEFHATVAIGVLEAVIITASAKDTGEQVYPSEPHHFEESAHPVASEIHERPYKLVCIEDAENHVMCYTPWHLQETIAFLLNKGMEAIRLEAAAAAAQRDEEEAARAKREQALKDAFSGKMPTLPPERKWNS